MKKMTRTQLRQLINESILKEELNTSSGGAITGIKAPWRNTGVSLITGIVKGNNDCTLIKEGFCGDRFVFYSDKPFKINGNESSFGSCKTVPAEQKEKLGGSECHTKTFKTSGSRVLFDLAASEDDQYILIEGI
jgi:hypothetical protein|tara:strand:- start:176 stop:577 length:402 start_codon:yes stop_codon:yes gene_type:complete